MNVFAITWMYTYNYSWQCGLRACMHGDNNLLTCNFPMHACTQLPSGILSTDIARYIYTIIISCGSLGCNAEDTESLLHPA